MAELEKVKKVIRGLECQYEPRMTCYGCDYFIARDKLCNKNKIFREAAELLEAQEPVMHSSRRGTNGISLVWTCGKCGADLEPNNRKARYCSSCGQAVKWNG